MNRSGVFSVEDVSCIVMPDGCLGLPTVAALDQDIPVIAVAENENVMRNDLSSLPWRTGQFHRASNYWEAAGLIAAMRSGIDPASVRRPLSATHVSRVKAESTVSYPEADFAKTLHLAREIARK